MAIGKINKYTDFEVLLMAATVSKFRLMLLLSTTLFN